MDQTHILVHEQFPNHITKHVRAGNTYTFTTENGVILVVSLLDEHIIRVRYSTTGYFDDDFSYALSTKFRGHIQDTDFLDDTQYYEVQTALIKCRIEKKTMRVSFLNQENVVINRDEKGFHWEENPAYGGDIVKMTKEVMPGEHFFGLGDKPTHFNLRGKRLRLWGMDEYGFERDDDPLYKNIPFYLGLHAGLGYGIFFDNTFQSQFDFTSERRNATSFWAEGGEMNYYFIYGPALLDVVRKYTRLTGVPNLPPKWALGYHQCKWSYVPEKTIREVTEKFRSLKLPCDAIYLDIDYMDGFRCFTWNKEHFPNPKALVSELLEKGFKTVAIIDPGIKIDEDYWVYREGMEKGYFCRRSDGPLMKGKVWPGECYFPDFTRPEVRKWWAGLYKDLIHNIGIRGIWNDMNEPAVFEIEGKTFPNDVRHDYDGHHCSHRKAHNIYGMQMARATYKGVKAYGVPRRPFVITRSCYSGTQRYSSVWTGDNLASWDHLTLANIQTQRLAISGMSFVGSDIGGFIDHPTSELYVRWVQLAIFHPFCRTHSSGDHGHQEPWSFGKGALNIVRKFIELRYRLLPYLYTTFYQYITDGTPMLRPLSFMAQDDEDTWYREDEFFSGDHILTLHMNGPGTLGRHAYLPKGNWYDYWTDAILEGGSEQAFVCQLDQALFFIREGAVIPLYPVMQYVGEKKIEIVELHIYFLIGHEKSELYEDAGDGFEYKKGDMRLSAFTVNGTEHNLCLKQERLGTYEPEYGIFELHFHGLPGAPKETGFKVQKRSTQDQAHDVYITQVPVGFEEIEIHFE
jgi:alpha-glucosidase